MPVERKYERDIDVLLAEEFAVNPKFAEWFKRQTKFATLEAVVADYWVSKSNNVGESDLVIVYQATISERFALLIEDKVDAPLQPDQAARYRLRAEQEQAQDIYSDYEVILCAPKHYIENRTDLNDFDRLISLEQLADVIRDSNDARSSYRADFLKTASTRRINAWSRKDDPTTNAFWEAAYQIATRDFPQLEMKRLSVTENSSWITFRPRDFPTQPKRVYISFKGDRGQIDLTFGNTTAYRFQPTIAKFLEPGMAVHQTAASSAVRIETQGFRIAEGIEAGMPKVRAAFEASSRLIAFYRAFRAQLDEAAKVATPL